jgi:hypothetical protein
MEDKQINRLFEYCKMIGDYKTDDGWLYLNNDNKSDFVLVEDLSSLISDVIRNGITYQIQKEILNKLESFYHSNKNQ